LCRATKFVSYETNLVAWHKICVSF
jgi:hypothetical protein